jgi:hypothetical protein
VLTWWKWEAFDTIAGEEATLLGAVFERCVAKRPLAVLVRGTVERVLGADQRALWSARPAQQPSPRALLLSTVYDRMRQVVWRIQPSGPAAYRAQPAAGGTSMVSVDHQLEGIEPHPAAALGR